MREYFARSYKFENCCCCSCSWDFISFFIFSLLIHLKHYFCIGTILNMLELFQTYLKHSKYIRNIPKSNYNYFKYIRAIPNMLEIFQINSKSLEKSSKTSKLTVKHLKKPFKPRFFLHISVFSCGIQTISAIITVLIMKWKQCSAWQQRILAVRIETTSKCHPNIVTCRTAIVKQIAVKNDFFF